MNNKLSHRGPDDHGEEVYLISGGWSIGFAQRRLSILDLSVNGHQPMHSRDGRITVIFNGEIYNFKKIKEDIDHYLYQTQCDTEIIIAAYLQWGIDFVDRLNGMFSIALLDREDDSVYFIRDRIGKKPFYYFRDEDNTIIFASELKAIMEYPTFRKDINKEVIGRYLHKQYISAPDTIFKNTYKLEAGGILKIKEGKICKWKYWDIADQYQSASKEMIEDYGQAKYELKEILKRAVSERLVADVPIGALLSGGYDSTVICALAAQLFDKPIKTFCIGFHNEDINEAHNAKKIADYLGTEHYELYLNEDDLLRMVADIPIYFDEPFADSSGIATMLVSELAKKQVSVVLSGDGGDELFGGYNIYTQLQKAQKFAMTGRMIQLMRKIPFINELEMWYKMPLYRRIASDEVQKEIKTQTGVSQYLRTINRLLLDQSDEFYYRIESKYGEKRYDITRMLLDQETYLPDDILVKVDRASMKYALECRCPILDKNVIEYSYRISPEFKDNKGNQKRILKDIAYEMVPKKLLDRPKAGFGIPMGQWMQGIMKEQILDWSNRNFLVRQGIFDPVATSQFLETYLAKGDGGKGSGNNYSQICWPYFIFQQWYTTYMA
ncbi:MAG: asparagine synthase (glutamine-hydrolyzing) [Ruminococcus sp.]|nr:asparagine synthase (glutamine-hydrolyzing) [Ruminococcus sp.]